jgi:hypothetical protein
MTFRPVQERDLVQGARIWWLVVYGLVIGALGVLASTFILRARTPDHASASSGAPSVAPRTIGSIEQTQVGATAAGMDLRARQQRELEGFRWVDRDAGVAAIPIERAMAIVAADAEKDASP